MQVNLLNETKATFADHSLVVKEQLWRRICGRKTTIVEKDQLIALKNSMQAGES
jgi:hypothetical protein